MHEEIEVYAHEVISQTSEEQVACMSHTKDGIFNEHLFDRKEAFTRLLLPFFFLPSGLQLAHLLPGNHPLPAFSYIITLHSSTMLFPVLTL